MEVYFCITVLLFIVAFAVYKNILKQRSTDDYHGDIQVPWEIKSIDSIDLKLYETPKPMVITDDLKDHIENVIKLTPKVKDIVQNEKKVIVKFSEEAINKLKSGEYKIMKKKGSLGDGRNIAVDQKNIIREHGALGFKKIKKVNPMKLANAAFGLLTIVTAQEHLDRINQQLTNIDAKISKLLRLYNNDKIGRIQGSIHYLRSITPNLENIKNDEKIYLIKIEDICLQCYQEIKSVFQEFPNIIADISKIKETTWVSVDDIVNEIKNIVISFEQNMLLCFGNFELMLICLSCRNNLKGDSAVNDIRLSDIENDFKSLLDFYDKFNNVLISKQQGLNATFRTKEAVNLRREELEELFLSLKGKVQRNKSDIDDKFKINKGLALVEPIELQLEYDAQGKIKAICRLKQAT